MLRSYLYVPGDQPSMFAKACALGGASRPDAVLLDLEDSVAPSRKVSAREFVGGVTSVARTNGASIVVRINSGAEGLRDVAAIAGPSLTAVTVPKATSESVAAVVAALAAERCSASVIALIESAVGVTELAHIAASVGVISLALGEADLCADLGIDRDAEHALWPIRMQVVVASVAAGLQPPIGPVATDFADLEGFRVSAQRLADAGFGARSAIHPTQVPVINEVYRPSAAAIARAQRVVGIFDDARAAGRGVAVDDDGRMIDEAVVRSARRVLNEGGN